MRGEGEGCMRGEGEGSAPYTRPLSQRERVQVCVYVARTARYTRPRYHPPPKLKMARVNKQHNMRSSNQQQQQSAAQNAGEDVNKTAAAAADGVGRTPASCWQEVLGGHQQDCRSSGRCWEEQRSVLGGRQQDRRSSSSRQTTPSPACV